MGAVKSLEMGEWLSLFCCIVLSCCLLPSPSESTPLQAGYVWNGNKQFANITGPTTYKKISTTYLVSSLNDRTTLALTIETSNTSAPVCYLEVTYFYAPYNASEPARPPGYPPNGESITEWTHPCPRTPLANGNCTFAFTEDGDMRLMNSVAGQTVLLWSSNTTGLGATTLDMLDYDSNDDEQVDGVLVLKNSTGDIVWTNVRNDSNFQCKQTIFSGPAETSQAAAAKKASVALLYLILSLGALVLWDLGTARSSRDQLLVFGFVVCCLLLPSTSQSKPIQAGFTANFTTDYVALCGELGNGTVSVRFTETLVVSPANRTDLALQILITNRWGPTCFLEVRADTYSTEIILNASAPAPSATDVNTFEYVPWAAPCPRKLLPNGNCTFSFTKDGDIQVLNGVGGGYEVVWSSNTTGLGATTLDVLDSDASGSGSIVLYNARKEVVWSNVRDMSGEDFQCGSPVAATSAAPPISIAPPPSLFSILFSSALLLKFLLF